MSNELTITTTLSYTNPAENVTTNARTFTDLVSVASGAYEANVQQVTNTQAPLPLSLIGTLGTIWVHNCDANNSINIWQGTGITQPCLTIGPGETQTFRFAQGAVPQVQTNAGTALLEYLAVDN